jgi:metal-sulfur cluster biosynthetic enzyme
MDVIAIGIRLALAGHGINNIQIENQLSPAWTTEWMTETGKEKLKAYGIAPPTRKAFADLGLFRRDGYRPYASWTENEKLALLERHLTDHFRAWAGTKDYHQLKKFFKNYTVDFEGCLTLRESLMQTKNTCESLEVIHAWRTRLR